jgi:hypothetical protein
MKDWLTVIAAFLAPVLAAAVALVSNLGRRQRLRLAIEIKDEIDESQRDDWQRMIRRDTAAIIASSHGRLIYLSIWATGAAITLLVALVPAFSRYRSGLNALSVALFVIALAVAAYYQSGNARQDRRDARYMAAMRKEIESTRADTKRLQQETEAYKHRTSAAREWGARMAFDMGAPLSTFHRIRLLRDADTKANDLLLVDRDSFAWRYRAWWRRHFSRSRSMYGTKGNEMPAQLRDALIEESERQKQIPR